MVVGFLDFFDFGCLPFEIFLFRRQGGRVHDAQVMLLNVWVAVLEFNRVRFLVVSSLHGGLVFCCFSVFGLPG